MHLEIFNKDQIILLPFLAKFKKDFYLVGGSAIALHIGHRLSIDFDLFKKGGFRPKQILTKFEQQNENVLVTLNRDGQLNLVCRNVKFTFFNFEYNIPHPISVKNCINMPTLIDLAAMKAFALGTEVNGKTM